MFLSCEIVPSATFLSSLTILSYNSIQPIFRCLSKAAATVKDCRVSEEVPVSLPNLQSRLNAKIDQNTPLEREAKKAPDALGGNGGSEIPGIHVPRQRYITVSKKELLTAILLLFTSQEEIEQFLLVSSCLDSILHAEHKSILEEMRVDYDLINPTEKRKSSNDKFATSRRKLVHDTKEFDSVIRGPSEVVGMENYGDYKSKLDNATSTDSASDLTSPLGASPNYTEENLFQGTRVAVATRFQRAFVQLLYNAQFEELSAMDLMLTSALNTDYLLTLPIYVDWKKASDSNAIIFRRGYATERQKGLLIVEKLDYLQSKLLQGIFFLISRPLMKAGIWFSEALKSTLEGQDAQWANTIRLWLKEMRTFQQSYDFGQNLADGTLGVDTNTDNDLPIWLAAQRAVTRYEGFLSSVGPRGRLLSKLLRWIGLLPPTPETPFDLNSDINASEPYLRPIFLSRISLADIWEPATRKSCGNDIWKMLKTAVSILFSQSVLQEPTFQELILLYTEAAGERETEDKVEVPSLQMKIYGRIPIPDLPVIFPHKKLSFRILDTVRLDIATILGLSAYFINYKFEDILSSPSAVVLDVIATVALIIYVTRVTLGYKQTRDRYQLLVNRTLYEKTIASGFGSVHFLLDASEQQQYKEAILAYCILLKREDDQVTCAQTVGDECERFMYKVFKQKIEMHIDKAIDTLVRLGLVTKQPLNGKTGLRAVSCPRAYEILKDRWNSLEIPCRSSHVMIMSST